MAAPVDEERDEHDVGAPPTASPLRALLWPAVAVGAAVAAAVGVGGDRGVVCGLFAFAAVLWVSEAIPAPATALVVIAAAPLSGACTTKEAFAALGNPVLFLFVGSFMIAEAMRLHGLGGRLAGALSAKATGRLSALAATSTAAFLLSMWISNAAATAVVLPIALALAGGDKLRGQSGAAHLPADTLPGQSDKSFRTALVLGVAWGASMGGLCTPVGTPPNLIGMRALEGLPGGGHPVSFAGWMAVGTPIGVAMLLAMLVVLSLRFGIRRGQPLPLPTAAAHRPWTRGEVAAASAFGGAVVCWIVPGPLELFEVGFVAQLKARVAEEVVAVIAAGALFFWPIHRRGEPVRRALSWSEAQRIDWGTVILFGGGILLGDLANKSGLVQVWGSALLDASGVDALSAAARAWAVTALVTAVALVLSELASNTASATLVIPLAIGLADAAAVSPVLAVLGATLGASFGFMMPISTAPNAMAYATGAVSVRQMASAGVVFDVIGYVIVVVFVLTLARGL